MRFKSIAAITDRDHGPTRERMLKYSPRYIRREKRGIFNYKEKKAIEQVSSLYKAPVCHCGRYKKYDVVKMDSFCEDKCQRIVKEVLNLDVWLSSFWR